MSDNNKPVPMAPIRTKMVRCRVVTRYGLSSPVGTIIEVTDQEYNRLRVKVSQKDETGRQVNMRWAYPVLITEEHAAEEALRERHECEEQEKNRRGDSAAADGPGWEEMEKQSRQLLDKQAIDAAARLREKATGTTGQV